MKKLKFIISASLIILVLSGYSQEAEATSSMIFVEVSIEEASKTFITITKPSALNEITRGFKPIKGNDLTFSGIVRDLDGISKLFINQIEIPVGAGGQFTTILNLPKGEQKVSFLVVDGTGNQTSKEYEVLVEEASNLPGLINGLGKYYALLIGINKYDDPNMISLDYPIDDVKSLARVLSGRYNFDEENITILTDATRGDIVESLDKLSAKISPLDNLLVFYAGHGYWDENASVGYWIPSNAKKTSTTEWYSNSTFTDQLRSIKSQHTLLIADACFSGGIFKSRAAFSDASQAVNTLYELKSRKAMTSGALTEVPDRSVFLKYLVKRLDTNSEKYISSEQLFSSIRMGVINNADVVPQYGTIQRAGDEGGDFIFILKD